VRWRIIPLMMAVVALAHFNRISITVAGAEKIIRPGFISATEMGVVYSAYLLPYTLFMMPGGWFIDRFGPRRAWILMGLGAGVFVALTGVAGLLFTGAVALWGSLLVVRGLLGSVSAPLHPTAARLVGNWAPPSKANLVNGLVSGAACLGIAGTYEIFGGLMDRLGWPRAFLVTAAITLVLATVWMAFGADRPLQPDPVAGAAPATWPHRRQRSLWSDSAASAAGAAPATRPHPRFLSLLRDRSLLCLTLSYSLVGYFQYLFFYWAQYYFEKVLHLPKETGRFYSTILTLAMGSGMVIGGWLSDRALSWFGPSRGFACIPVLGLLLSSVAVIFGLVGSSPSLILLWFTVAMGAVGMSEGSYWTASVRVGGLRGGMGAAIMNTGGNAGGLLAPVLTPLISDLFGWRAGLGMASLVCVVGAILWIPVRIEDKSTGTSSGKQGVALLD
jgi:MFS transporter, ACS family, D-galactonate transporter